MADQRPGGDAQRRVIRRETWATRELLEDWQRERRLPGHLRANHLAPERPGNAGWQGRAGRVEWSCSTCAATSTCSPDKTVVYICGNPDMIINVESELLGAGFPEFHVKKELYWPKGKTVPVPQAAPTGRRLRSAAAHGRRGRAAPAGVTFGPPFRACTMFPCRH